MPGKVIDPNQNPSREGRYGILFDIDRNKLSRYDKAASGSDPDILIIPAGCLVEFEHLRAENFNWNDLQLENVVKITSIQPDENQGPVVRRILNLMRRYPHSMFRDVDDRDPALPPRPSHDSGGYGPNINRVIGRQGNN